MEPMSIAIYIAAILSVCYLYIKYKYLEYWKRKGLPYLEPEFFYGNTRKLIKGELSFGEQLREIHRQLKAKGLKHGGAFLSFSPFYMPTDPEIIKNIMQTDFDHFVNHGFYFNEKDDPLTGHLFNLENSRWRELRVKLTPTFTSGKMKMMFETLVACSDGLEAIIRNHSIVHDAVDIKDLSGRFTTDVIGSCAFGLDCNSLKNPDSEFRQFGKKVFESSFLVKLKLLAVLIIPKSILTMLHFKFIEKDVESFFMKVVKDTVEHREKNNIFRKDFVHLMLQIKNKGKVTDDKSVIDEKGNNQNKDTLTMNEFAAQCFVFFAAGFETSSTTMTFALYQLALNQDVQDKLRENIRSVLKKHEGKLTYESVMEMSYLDKVINETLRLHPPVPALPRACNKAYTVPGTDVVLDPDTKVQISVYALHTDPEYYPNPEKFEPERFSEENKAKRPAFTFLPFGDGPRICIGLRFGVMQSKVGLIRILKDYRVTLNDKTKYPIKLDSKVFITAVDGRVWLNVSKVS